MSSEERVVRPYLRVARLQRVLDGFSLHVGYDVLDHGEKLVLSPLDYLTRPIDLALGGDGAPLADVHQQLSKGIADLGIDRDDLEMLVVVSTPRLKLSEIVLRRSANDLDSLGQLVNIASGIDRPSALRTPFGGCRIDVYLVLARQLERTVLRPWRKGTWIGCVTFVISTDLGELGFTPLPLDDDARSHLKVPTATNRVVRIDGSVLDPDLTHDALQLFVDSDLLAELAYFPDTPGARSFQRQLFLDAGTSIVMHAVASPELDDRGADEIDGSLLGRLVSLVAGRRAGEPEHVLGQRREQLLAILRNDPTLFLAYLEAHCGTKKDLASSIISGNSI